MFDLLIKNGTIINGTGSPSFYGDIGIKDGKIARIGKGLEGAKTVIDATGLTVTPGFIDSHSHSDSPLLEFPQLLEKILAYVAENTASIQSTAEVATALGLSPQYLSAYFSRHIGTPLKIYIQAKKIALAKDLLSKGADVTGACFDSGFNDCSYFIRVFKHYVGVTPLRYRQDLRR